MCLCSNTSTLNLTHKVHTNSNHYFSLNLVLCIRIDDQSWALLVVFVTFLLFIFNFLSFSFHKTSLPEQYDVRR